METNIQDSYIKETKAKCIKSYGENVTDNLNSTYKNGNLHCPPFWDGILCWQPTVADTYAVMSCPEYVAGFDKTRNATRQCMQDAKWFINSTINNDSSWTDYSKCYNTTTVTVIATVPSINATLIKTYMPIIKYIARTGYFVSLTTLIVAFCIMFSMKKLHCARNKLHMHLFASFIFRAAMFFLKDILFIEGVGMSSDLVVKNGNKYFLVQSESNNWECKMFTSLWQYFITANYSWILMEGLYLHNLILLALFTDSNSIRYYVMLGWGLPAIVIGSYIGARISLDDNLCWTTYDNPYTFLIIRIPTMISNIINLVLFINIARVLLLKLRSPINEETKLYRRWARSTLVLVPLFGVHYALFIGMSYSMGIDETVELIWLFCDQLFASFQGFFVAVLYCFLNGEVKTELRPHFNNFVSVWLAAPFSVFFNCGEFSRSTKGRPSVCTTLSCSSLYNSSVTQKYQSRRSKYDISQPNGKPRHSSIPEKFAENCANCQSNEIMCQEHSYCWKYDSSATLKCTENACFCSNGNTQITEITACLGRCDHSSKCEAPSDMEMISLANQ